MYIVIIVFQSTHIYATGTNEGVAARQEVCLRLLTESDSVPAFTKHIANYVKKKNSLQVNEYLTLLEPDQLNFARAVVLLRILILDQTEDVIEPSTRVTLGDTLSQYIKESLPLLNFFSPDHFELESVQLAKPMILLSWCLYLKSHDLEYDWFPLKTLSQQKEKQTKKIEALLNQWLRSGFVFRGSYEYIPLLTSLINLYDLCDDENMKTKAVSLAETIITEMALENIDGLWGGVRQNTYTLLSPVTTQWMSYLFFGSYKPERIEDVDPGILILCQTEYRLPQLLERLGRDRTHRGIFELKHRYQTHTESLDKQEEVRKYSYITPEFILSSFQLQNQTVPWQSRPWDLLLWNEERQNTHVVSFNGKQFVSGKDPVEETEYTVWNATNWQHKNVLYSQYHKCSRFLILDEQEKELLIPNYEQLPSRIWIPTSLAPIEQEGGWQFIHAGKVFIALRPIQGNSYWWRTAETGHSGSEAAAILGFRDLYAGMIMEVETESIRVSSYNQFKQQVINAPLVIDQDSVTFVSRRGDVYFFPRNGGDFLVNGKRMNADNDDEYEWFSNPFVHSQWDSGLFEAKWNPFSLLIDIRDPHNPIRRINSN